MFYGRDRDSIEAKVASDSSVITVEGKPGSDFFVIQSGEVAVDWYKRLGTLTKGTISRDVYLANSAGIQFWPIAHADNVRCQRYRVVRTGI